MPDGADPPRDRSGQRGSIKTPIVGAIVLANAVVFLLLLWTFQSAVKRDAEDIGRDYSLQLRTHLSEVVDIFGASARGRSSTGAAGGASTTSSWCRSRGATRPDAGASTAST